ncbi:tRNA pseudouridine(55) synthase [Caenorhabditis elegans]|uniref:tRNA pseudouridine(55) synthase n=1 Tax=Caenorhabditis elegans TaxID=6239 RepID=Q9U287_CAEEL|nr:tRNA pseudouridine(55) synthase [Caenorhabditis elegans]CAB60423.2 tRNA pseudouridine(55) synthase [Caenorhabditis elegans]
MSNDKTPLVLCEVCVRQISGDAEEVTKCENSFECQLCFGIMDQAMIDEVGEKVQEELSKLPYDSMSFILALNLPVGQTLREILVSRLRPDFNGTLASVPYKVRNIDGYLKKLGSYSGKRPTLSSDLQLMITFEQEESNFSDLQFLQNQFPNDFRVGKRGRYNNNQEAPSSVSKQQLQQVTGRINEQIAKKYIFKSPTRKCTFQLQFERDPVYIAGRYCKYSRCLPQSPWSEDKDAPREPGNSVSEKVCDLLKKQFGASDSRFVTSGREDIDVRMLGTGRPFVVELRNCRTTAPVRGIKYLETLKTVQEAINVQKDVKVVSLTRVPRDVSEKLCVGEEDKRKQYCAYCYSILPISDSQFTAAQSKIPLKIVQKTPVRVMKRRALLDRERWIYSMNFLKLDDHHFEVRLETQAGTYIKEFVHGDFGRTRPSLAELLDVEHGEVDILELDVEKVDLEWPPELKDGQEPVKFR